MKSSQISGRDITGLVSGRLTALCQTDRMYERSYYWRCSCLCGNTIEVRKQSLVVGVTKSCGCLNKENKTKHGVYSHPLYRLLRSIKSRCYNSNVPQYSHYGGRGIKVCQEWLDNPVEFIKWAEANGYRKGLQIDRINNDGGYSIKNCRFVTPRENTNNRRNTVYVLLKEEKTLAVDASIKLGISIGNIYDWIRNKRVTPRFQHLVTLIEDDNLN